MWQLLATVRVGRTVTSFLAAVASDQAVDIEFCDTCGASTPDLKT
jgi:hypothetical protein